MNDSGFMISQAQDKRTWQGDPSGEFSVASSYKFLNNGGTRMPGSEVIWKISAPSIRQRLSFGWRLMIPF